MKNSDAPSLSGTLALKSVCAPLMAWYGREKRSFPWRVNPDPYRTWICEVMSQQTTLAVVTPKFRSFVEALPHVAALAACSESVMRELWAGLGYYARARNLHKGAHYIMEKRAGQLPCSYNEWLAVPGCGPYTAAIIASICYDERVAAVDGNVIRVMSRFLCLEEQTWSRAGQKSISDTVQQVVQELERPGEFNQALMELGATLCRRQNPQCALCPLASHCRALLKNRVACCPPPKPRREFCERHLVAMILVDSETNEVAVFDRLAGFLAKTAGFPFLPGGAADMAKNFSFLQESWISYLRHPVKHTITHHRIVVNGAIVEAPWQRLFTDSVSNLILESEARLLHWVPLNKVESSLSSSLDKKVWQASALGR